MNWLDLVLLLSAVSFAFSGYRQGFVAGVLAFTGFLGGGVIGLLVAPVLVSGLNPGLGQSLLAVAIVLFAATVGQVTLGWLGSMLRSRLTWRPVRMVDAGLGAGVSVVAMLVVAWFLASALRPGPLPSLSHEIGDSRVIAGVDSVMPDRARTLFSSFRRVLDDSELPPVFSGLAPETIRSVPPPDGTITGTPAVRAAGRSVVKVVGTAESCSRTLDGSGFVFAPQHVLTNAHVVAGVDRPTVRLASGDQRYDARVVLFDSKRDLAVLYVPDLRLPALDLSDGANRGDEAVVAGYPGGGPFRLVAARIRNEINATGPDIYHRTEVTRDLYALYADVEPGNSGGPLLDLKGRVDGVVFAKSLDDPKTGYALTTDEARGDMAAGRDATTEVGTGACA
ncbi:MAG TPA: MarP family serine protease [Actinomycetes bacterium]